MPSFVSPEMESRVMRSAMSTEILVQMFEELVAKIKRDEMAAILGGLAQLSTQLQVLIELTAGMGPIEVDLSEVGGLEPVA